MDTHPENEPDDDLPDLWAVPLHEPTPPDRPAPGPPISDGSAPLNLFESDDLPSDVGFHPRLRRFDEVA